METRPRGTALALTAIIAFAPGHRAAALQGAPRDTVVRTAGAPVHARNGTLVEELSVGVVDGDENYMFGDVADVALGRDGSVYVYDRRVPVVRQYDAKGKFIRNVGRSGSGPGEYRSVSGLAVMKDGRLLVWDTGNWRVNVYSAAGDFMTQWATPSGSANSTATYTRAIMVDTAGIVWCRGNIIRRGPGGITRDMVWFRVDAGGIRDTLSPPPMPPLVEGLTAVGSGGSATSSAVVPFTPQPSVQRSPFGYFVTGMPSRYAVEIVAPGAGVTSIRRDGVKPQPVTASERSFERERIETMMRRTQPGWTWNGPEIPPAKPFYSGIAVGLDGRIWLAVIPETARRVGSMGSIGIGTGGGAPRPAPLPQRPDQPALYDVFESNGTYLGAVQVPPRVSTVLRRGDQVWAVAYDEDDVSFVKRYRISWR